MADHAVDSLMSLTMEKVKQMVDSDTIIGKPINTNNGTVIFPISKVSVGLASGGSDFSDKNTKSANFGGGGGAGVSIAPVAFLVVNPQGEVRTIQLSDSGDTLDRLITMIPEIIDKVTAKMKEAEKDKKERREHSANMREKNESAAE